MRIVKLFHHSYTEECTQIASVSPLFIVSVAVQSRLQNSFCLAPEVVTVSFSY